MDDLENEVWVRHPIGIMVSNMGRVETRIKGKHFGHKDSTPYLKVNWKGKPHRVHRLICEAFKDNPDNLPTVDHIDRNPLNNRADNLRWADRSTQNKNREVDYKARTANTDYKAKVAHTDYKAIGEKNAAKLSIPIIQLNKDTMEIVREWKSAHQAEREGGYVQSNITKCCKGRYKTCGGFIWRYAN